MKVVKQVFYDVIRSTEPISLDIECKNRKWQKSIRMVASAYKRKLPSILVDDIGISKITENDKYYVRIYKTPVMSVYKVDSTGKRIKIEL